MTGLLYIYTAADEYSNGDRCAVQSLKRAEGATPTDRQKGKRRLKGNTGGDRETSGLPL